MVYGVWFAADVVPRTVALWVELVGDGTEDRDARDVTCVLKRVTRVETPLVHPRLRSKKDGVLRSTLHKVGRSLE
jgi:hypothetical protein